MIIDVNTYLGHWPFRNLCNNTAQGLSGIAEKNNITHMLVASLNAIFYKDTMKGNMELYNELQSYQGNTKFIPFAVINPTYPAWKQDMENAIKKYGFEGVELCPTYHNYSLVASLSGYTFVNPAAEAFRLAGELGIPVRINAGFENFRQRHHMDVFHGFSAAELFSLLSSCDNTTAILNGLLPHTLGAEIQQLLKTRKNIFFDFTRVDTFIDAAMERTLAFMDASHLCFGTQAPFQYVETNLIKVLFTSDPIRQKILGDNIRGYLKGI